jgi:hypothetical protein
MMPNTPIGNCPVQFGKSALLSIGNGLNKDFRFLYLLSVNKKKPHYLKIRAVLGILRNIELQKGISHG